LEITWLGSDNLLLRGREARVLLSASADETQLAGRTGADIVVGPVAEENSLRPTTGPQVVARPGEYELRGVSVRGISVLGGVVFVTEVDEVAVCNFGALPAELSDRALEELGFIDVLGLSLEGGSSARAQMVAQFIARVQPGVMVPTGYQSPLDAAPGELAALVREMGLAQVSPQPKLTLSGSLGSADDTRVVVLEPRR